MMQESESREYAKSVVAAFAGKAPQAITLLSSGHGPLGWSQNRIWKADIQGRDALVLKLGDGPMSELVLREIDLLEEVLPTSHPNLPVVHSFSREPTPYVLMEWLTPVLPYPDLADTPSAILHELGRALATILLSCKSECLVAELPGRKDIPGVPSAVSYGYLNLRNLGRRTDGTLVIFDWDGVRIAPLGSDFKLFQKHRAFAETMVVFHDDCQNAGFGLPSFDEWLKRLLEMWKEEDEMLRISQL
ncbi:MAG: hypothetical protein C0404_12390 [Verrucomicrobia bacterium]|nr:hypothetical protein [Verrucomicrobiota bacterium]